MKSKQFKKFTDLDKLAYQFYKKLKNRNGYYKVFSAFVYSRHEQGKYYELATLELRNRKIKKIINER